MMENPVRESNNMELERVVKVKLEQNNTCLCPNLIMAFRLVHRLDSRSRVLPMSCRTNPNQDCNRWI